MAPLMATELSKQHRRFPNESKNVLLDKTYILVDMNHFAFFRLYAEFSETLQQSTRKNYHFIFGMCG